MPTRLIRGNIWLTSGILAAAAAGHMTGWLPLQAVAGLGMILLAPGLCWLPIWLRLWRLGPAPGGFHLLLGTGLLSVAGHALSQTVITLAGGDASFWPLWWGAALLSVAGGALAAWWALPLEPWRPSPMGRAGAAMALAAVVFTLGTSSPRFVGADSVWSEELYSLLARHLPEQGRGAALTPEEGWRSLGDGGFALDRTSGVLRAGAAEGRAQLRFALQNLGPTALAVEVLAGGEALPRSRLVSPAEVDFPRLREAADPALLVLPRMYDPATEPRNSPPPLRLLVPSLPPGPERQQLLLRVRPLGPGSGSPRVKLVDLGGLSPEQVSRRLAAHFLVGDTGDLYETLEFSRSFQESWLQRSSSFDGDRHDGGGPTSLSDEPPGHHFMAFLALTLVHDRLDAVSLLFLLELALLLLLCVHLAALDNPRLRRRDLLPLLGVALIYTRLCRFGLESAAPDTLFVLLLLAAAALLLEARTRMAALLAAAALWVHVPAPHAALLLGLAAWGGTRRREGPRFVAQAAGAMALLLLARYLAVATTAGWDGAWHSGQAAFLAGNRSGMIKAILLEGRLDLVAPLAHVSLEWARLVLVAAAGTGLIFLGTLLLPAARRPAERDAAAWTLLLFGLLYLAATSLLDLHRPHHVGPIIFPLAVALCRRIPTLRGKRTAAVTLGLAVTAGAAALLFFWLLAGPDPTDTLNPVHLGNFAHMPMEIGPR